MKNIFSFFAVLVLSTLSNAKGDDEYVWPLKRQPVLTSSFGEARVGHIHAGIDLSTGGKIGEPVYAVSDGEVMRLSFSPWGYGKAVYLRLNDDKIVVYGHLSRLVSLIGKRVYREQLRCGRYRVNFYLSGKRTIAVKKGQLIAFSGETGSGHPHLHFEVRSKTNYPINPLVCKYRTKDDYIPTIHKVQVAPLGTNTRINGERNRYYWKLISQKGKRALLADTLWLNGRAGISVNASDYISRGGYSVCTYERSLHLNDSLLFKAQYDTIPYEVGHQVLLDRDIEAWWQGKGKFEKLYREYESNLPIYCGFKYGDGIIDSKQLPSGIYPIKIAVRDAWGNSKTARGHIGLTRSPILEDFKSRKDPSEFRFLLRFKEGEHPVKRILLEGSVRGGKWRKLRISRQVKNPAFYKLAVPLTRDSLKFFRIMVIDSIGAGSNRLYCACPNKAKNAFNGSLKATWVDQTIMVDVPVNPLSAIAPITKMLLGDSTILEVPLVRRRLGSWRGTIDLSGTALNTGKLVASFPDDSLEMVRSLQPYLIRPQDGGLIISADSFASVYLPAKSVASPKILELGEYRGKKLKFSKELKPRSKIYATFPSPIYTDVKFEMEMKIPASKIDTLKTAIFTWNGKKWDYAEGVYDRKTRTYKAKSSILRPFALFEDTTPPSITYISVRDRTVYRHSVKMMKIKIKEKGCGIESDLNIVTKIDNRIFINEYDPERREAKILNPRLIKQGNHVLTVIVKDALGNQVVKKRRFRIKRR